MSGALLQAIEDCRYIQARLLIDKGVNINTRNRQGCTPLIMALTIPDQQRRFKMFRWLLRMGADSSYIDANYRRDMLSWAAYYNRTDQVRCILEADEGLLNFQHQDKFGRTAMHYATMHNNVESLQLIVTQAARYGLTVDVRDQDGLTPYLMASMMRYEQCRAILVDIGCAVSSQMVLTFINLPRKPAKTPANPFEQKLSRSVTNLTDNTLPSLGPMKKSHTSKSLTLRPGSPIGSGESTGSSSILVTPAKKSRLPRLMDILSQQASQTYRPAARLPVVAPPPAAAAAPTADTDKNSVISLQAAIRITTMAASFRKRKQLSMNK